MHRQKWWWRMLTSPVGFIGAALVGLFVVLAVIGPWVFGHGANTNDVTAALQGPSGAHPLGTDGLGRDLLDRVLTATRRSLEMAALATLISGVGGALVGAAPAALGRRSGRLVAAAIDLSVAFPGLLLAIFLTVIFGSGTRGAVLAVGIASIPGNARLTQTLTASVAGADYIAAARLLRVGRLRILARHVLPNIAEPLIINFTVGLGGALLAFAGLSFLGLGVQPPAYDWGGLLSQALPQIYLNPAGAIGPGVAVVLTGASFNLLGDAAARCLGGSGLGRRRVRGTAPLEPPARALASTAAVGPDAAAPALRVEGLRVAFPAGRGWVSPVEDVTLEVAAGEMVGVVGESGSGKSLTASAIGSLVEHPGVVTSEATAVAGQDLSALGAAERNRLLGWSLSMVFQDPLSALNPALRVGRQLAEVAEVHQHSSRRAAMERAVDRLGVVRLPDPARRARQYPHEMSGGMRQRAVIGMGLMGTPKLLIADEPTTALDVTVQREVLEVLRRVRDDQGAAVVLISHDIAVVSEVCQRVIVMYAGRIVEDIPVGDLASRAAHPYTRALVASIPDMATDRGRPLATIAGRPPDPAARPDGCAFAPRCPFATDRCRVERPPLDGLAPGRRVACWHPQHQPADAPSHRATVGS